MPVPPPLPATLEFTGERKGFFDLVARGAGLELITLGFYRFWLVTDVRRHLWSNTVIDGDAAEYTGRGRELLIGFLIAMAVLMPIYLGYFLVGIEAERWQALASFPLIAAFYVFGQFAIYRARRYRLTRTIWRGVRFWMDGSGWAYAARATLWGVFAILTLGIASPWRAAALERYKMRHSWYGDLQGDFEGRGWELFKKVWWLWPVTPIALFIFPLLPFLYAYYKAVEWRWWLSGIRFGEVRVQSTLEPSALQGLYWKVIGWSVLFFTVFGILIAGAVPLLTKLSEAAGPDAVMQTPAMIAVTVIGYLALALGISVVARLYLSRDLWVRVLASTTVTGLEAAANVAARGDLASALGEGFADGLDVGGF
ncbi:DUF898 family protein [Bradyrhizobium lablabi]|nr:DUF898 family protein [Bradyrhizobium lablabi]MBR1121214.1 DUF898 family protein [Bradyrhizobium lablabi]